MLNIKTLVLSNKTINKKYIISYRGWECESKSYHITNHEHFLSKVKKVMGKMFLKNENELDLIEFVYKYQYISVKDVIYFFNSKSYYKKRITNLVKLKYLRRYKNSLVLGEQGTQLMKLLGNETKRLNYDKKYIDRLKYVSHLGAFYHNCPFTKFIPSFQMKDKEKYTITSRRFIGELNINNIKYLVYHIPKESKNSYINSIIYDIQKEKEYSNILVLVDDINRIDLKEFVFGINRLVISEDIDTALDNLKYMHNINWSKIIKEKYGNMVFLSEYNFCDYTDKNDKFVSTFYLLDTEKINKINTFLRNNEKKNMIIICNEQISKLLKKEIPNAIYEITDLYKYIDMEIHYYD